MKRDASESADQGDAIERAWDALERDDPERALAIVTQVDAQRCARHVVEAAAWIALDDIAEARAALDRADALDLPFDDVDGLWTRAALLLREWRIAEAEAVYESIEQIARDADVLDSLAFCAELRHDRARAERFLAAAEELDPEGFARPPALPEREFGAQIDAAVAELPEPFRQVLDECRIDVLPVPTAELARLGDPADLPPDTLGVLGGHAPAGDAGDDDVDDRAQASAAELPPVIYLFQRNLERASRDREHLVETIRVTLYHEVGHLLGFDEEDAGSMG